MKAKITSSDIRYCIEMSSRKHGSEVFKYDSPEERIAGFNRLMVEVEKQKDGVHRNFYFNTMEKEGEYSRKGAVHVARWDGEKWEFLDYTVTPQKITLRDGNMYDRKELAAALEEDCSALTDAEVAYRVGEKFRVKVLDYGPTFVPRYLIEMKKRFHPYKEE